ncbi:MAG: 2-oxoglutarate-dependent dioxygenase, partial [Methylobacter sp.]
MVEDISPAWRDWIISNLQRGCTRQSMIEAMVQAQFDATVAADCIERTAASLAAGALADEPYRYEPSRIAPGNTIRLS